MYGIGERPACDFFVPHIVKHLISALSLEGLIPVKTVMSALQEVSRHCLAYTVGTKIYSQT